MLGEWLGRAALRQPPPPPPPRPHPEPQNGTPPPRKACEKTHVRKQESAQSFSAVADIAHAIAGH
jgi:hypothetical protein